MKKIIAYKSTWLALTAVVIFVGIASPAQALDAYRDRRGFFAGLGLGGGGAFQDGSPGGALLFDFQLGGGASENLTFALDTDIWFHLMDEHNNFLLTPGPEVNYFFGDSGVFVRAGIGMALTWVRLDIDEDIPGAEGLDDTDFTIGFDSSVGVGWEFFGSSNWAFGLALEGDYIVLKGDDIFSVGFAVNLKYY